MRGYRGEDGVFTYSIRDGFSDQPLTIPCGSCIACRINHSYEWGMRGHHEASLHSENIFCTATYDDDNLPFGGNLHRPDVQVFLQKLRHSQSQKIRNLYSGEYGDQTDRPHYHICIFNYRPDDAELLSQKGDRKYYNSPTLTALWGKGDISFSDVTHTSAAYTMSYTIKKQYGDLNAYDRTDPDTGEIYKRQPPFSGASTRPGIGIPWLLRFLNDTYKDDIVVINGKPSRPCKAYDVYLQRNHEKLWRTVRAKRKKLHTLATLRTNPKRQYFETTSDQESYTKSDQCKRTRALLLEKRQTERNEQ